MEGVADNECGGERLAVSSRKRKRQPENWPRNIRQKKKALGLEHNTARGIPMASRQTGPPCHCRKKCFTRFTEAEIQQLLSSFSALGSKNLQDAHLFGLVARNAVRRRRTRCGTGSEKSFAYTYKVRCLDRNVVVCKCAFASIHGISTRRVESVLHRSHSATTSPLDKRGKHKNRPNRTDDETNSNIDEHIQSFPAKSSHYSRNDNHNKKYLSEDLSVAKMHRLYLEAFEPDVAAELCLGGDSKPAVKYEYYLNRFNTHHNLSFGRPRSDTCPTCDMIELKMKEESDASTKARLEAEKQLHLRKAERFYTSMQEHSALAARDPTVATLAFDFEQNLPVPVLPVGDLFYARQLWLYNFGIHDCGTNTGTMYCWDETTSKRGSNEVASCLLHYINNSIPDEVKTLYLYSDGCGGQNKNYTIIHFLHSLVKMERFELIMHVFPIRGHSFLPCDRDFGSIEMKKRKVETLYIPDQWIAIIEGARVKNKFDVVRVTQDMTFDFQKELAPFFKKVVKTGTAKLRVRDARVFRYDRAHDVSVKYSMSPLEEPLGFVLEKPRSVIIFPSVPAYNAKLPIRAAKLKDLLSLSAKYIPSRYKTFYDNLTSSTTAVDSDNED